MVLITIIVDDSAHAHLWAKFVTPSSSPAPSFTRRCLAPPSNFRIRCLRLHLTKLHLCGPRSLTAQGVFSNRTGLIGS